MTICTPTQARANLYKLIDYVNISHEPVHIAGQRKGAVLISEEDWRDIQETLYLNAIPGMKKSLQKGMKLKISECAEELDW
ncbi:MAG: Prevent-host-death family protein [Gammaproteobacteria bacterium]|jgi:PHD/YefM family antitoxin component YafN of YafNO toxin-antitoxin module|nr:Prevent-host-death family protein [Gammaproteobacteria bacterium]